MAPVASYFANSDGLVTRSEFKYPVDMSASAVKDTLIKRNLLVAWESIKKVNNLQVDGQIVNYTYDALMRLSTANARAGNVVTTYTYTYKDVNNTYNKINASTAFTSVSGSSLTNKTDVQYFDGLGRLVETVKKAHSPSSKDVALAIVYDNTGPVSREYIPYEGTLGQEHLFPFLEATTPIPILNMKPPHLTGPAV